MINNIKTKIDEVLKRTKSKDGSKSKLEYPKDIVGKGVCGVEDGVGKVWNFRQKKRHVVLSAIIEDGSTRLCKARHHLTSLWSPKFLWDP